MDIKIMFLREITTALDNCKKREVLIKSGEIKEGDSVTFKGYRQTNTRLMFVIEHKRETYNIYANYWLKEMFKEIEKTFMDKEGWVREIPCFDCVVGVEKYTPTTKTQEHIFIRTLPIDKTSK
jgi:hypothetical protein